jgi:hypothetical protein
MSKLTDIRGPAYQAEADEVSDRLAATPGTYLAWRHHLDTCGPCAETGGCRTESQLWAAYRRTAS